MPNRTGSLNEKHLLLVIGIVLLLTSTVFAYLVITQKNLFAQHKASPPISRKSGAVLASPTAQPSLSPTSAPTQAPPVNLVALSLDDSIKGTGANQFNFVGSWQNCASCGAELYNGSNAWSNTAGDTLTVIFHGVQVKFYGVVDKGHGIGAVSIDGGAETMIDFYSANRQGDIALWTSPLLPSTNHIFKLRVTGNKNDSSAGTYVTADRLDVILSGADYVPVKYEAENAQQAGGANINNNHAGYSGSGFVDGYWAAGANTTFTVTVPTSKAYNVILHYANSTGETNTLSIFVNGVKVKQTSLPTLTKDNWDLWADATETITLNAGINTIMYKYDAGDTGKVNLDYIVV